MRISARNQLEGVVKKIEKGEVASVVKIEIAEPAILTVSGAQGAAQAPYFNAE